MTNVKSIAVVISAVIISVILSVSFQGTNILERSIILGIGVDYDDNGMLFTAEVVSPGNGSEQIGTYCKTVSVYGNTCGDALQQIAEVTGKEASLGQTVLLILGENFCKNHDFGSVVDFFVMSDGFKENSAICCCKGSAKDFFNNGLALQQSVSIALSQALLNQAESVGVSSNNLLEFVRSQRELYQTGYINYVEFVPSPNTDNNNGKTQGYVNFNNIVVYRNNRYVCTLDNNATRGLALLDDKVKGETFSVTQDGLTKTVVVNGKKVDVNVENNDVTFDITLYAKFARTESDESGGPFASKNRKQFSPLVIQSVVDSALEYIDSFIAVTKQYDFDLVNVHEVLRSKQGTNSYVTSVSINDFNFIFNVNVVEK